MGDPKEAALLVLAAKAGISTERLNQFARLAELPFDSARKRMTTIYADDSKAFACVKGAPSEILPRCSSMLRDGASLQLGASSSAAIDAAHEALIKRGWRVLAVATRQVQHQGHDEDAYRVDDVERNLSLLGLVAMEDPPRPEVPAAIAACQQAGIRAIMATGDDGHTGAASAQIGMLSPTPRIVPGGMLNDLADAELALLLGDSDVVFARVTPEHKLRIVEALQRRGDVVAVTGDGVNDAPALQRADIGVAMGCSGTDVARQVADIILLDDNFATIVTAIEEGRGVYDNVRKFITYIFASNVPELVPFIAFVLFRIPLPLTVMQILAVDLGTDLVPALALGTELPEPHVMRRPPRRRDQRLLDWPTLMRAYAWLGLIEAALCLTGFFATYWLAGWQPGAPMDAEGPLYVLATTMSLAGIVACQVGNGFACRSSCDSLVRQGLFTNRFLLLGIGVEVLILTTLIYAPPLARTFQLSSPEPIHWCILAVFGPLLLLCEETRKWLLRRWARR